MGGGGCGEQCGSRDGKGVGKAALLAFSLENRAGTHSSQVNDLRLLKIPRLRPIIAIVCPSQGRDYGLPRPVGRGDATMSTF